MKELIALAFAAALAVFLVWAMHSEGRFVGTTIRFAYDVEYIIQRFE